MRSLKPLTDPLNQIVSAVKIALEQTPPELGADIADAASCSRGAEHCCVTSIGYLPKRPACRCSLLKIR